MDFTIPTVETSLMLTTPTPKRVEVAFKEQFWTFLQPFSRNLWLVLLFGGVFTAIFMYFADPKTTEPLTAVSGVKDRSGRYDQGVLSILRHSLFSISNLFYQVKSPLQILHLYSRWLILHPVWSAACLRFP